MNFSNDNIKELVESFIPFIRRLIRKETSDCVRINVAQIISIESDGKCKVRFSGSPDDGSKDIDIQNKYGIGVSVGDYVNVQYWNNSTDSYIASTYSGSSQIAPSKGNNILLPSTAWNGGTSCTVDVSNMNISPVSTIFITPTNASYEDWCDNEVRCTESGSGTLSFTCSSTPPDITYNIVVWNA